MASHLFTGGFASVPSSGCNPPLVLVIGPWQFQFRVGRRFLHPQTQERVDRSVGRMIALKVQCSGDRASRTRQLGCALLSRQARDHSRFNLRSGRQKSRTPDPEVPSVFETATAPCGFTFPAAVSSRIERPTFCTSRAGSSRVARHEPCSPTPVTRCFMESMHPSELGCGAESRAVEAHTLARAIRFPSDARDLPRWLSVARFTRRARGYGHSCDFPHERQPLFRCRRPIDRGPSQA
jgi:hypothetical protein